MNQMAQMSCPSCKAQFGAEINAAEIFNTQSVSVVTLTHEHPLACPHCFKNFALQVGGIGQIALGLVPYVEPSKLVQPPNGFKGQ